MDQLIYYVAQINSGQLWQSANKYDLPWYSRMLCCCRISSKLFEEKGELFFTETMINTIANHSFYKKKLKNLKILLQKPVSFIQKLNYHKNHIHFNMVILQIIYHNI